MACGLRRSCNQEVTSLFVITNGISHIGGTSYKTASQQSQTISVCKTFVHADRQHVVQVVLRVGCGLSVSDLVVTGRRRTADRG